MSSWGARLRSTARQAEPASPPPDDGWLERFHAGDLGTIEACYREHFGTAERAIGSILSGADRETAIHELFARVMSSADLRRSFRGGSLAAWLGTVARHQAIDVRRRMAREVDIAATRGPDEPGEWEQTAEARLLVERFRRDHLPPAWAGVFELRFLQQLPQREAAARLLIRRTTLAYRELRIRRLLTTFLLTDDLPPLTRKGKP
jgi:RNA polymerase sigma-70 factor (ECF subfamily)